MRCVAAGRRLHQRHQRERAALALIVGAQQQQHIFAGNDQDQRPQDQRQHAEHGCTAVQAAILCRRDRLAKSVKRAGADIAIDHARAADDERGEGAKTGGRRDVAMCGFSAVR